MKTGILKNYGARALFAALGTIALWVPEAIAAQAAGQLAGRAESLEPSGTSLAYFEIPLSFEANRGQTDARVDFLARGAGYGVFLTPGEAVLALESEDGRPAVLRLQLMDASPSARAVAMEELPSKVHYFVGRDPAGWRPDVPTYAGVRYAEVYPGIDLVYRGNQRQLEYDFVMAPGADPGTIRLRFEGAQRLALEDGTLVLYTAGGELRQPAARIYQEVDGVRRVISGGYALVGENEVGFSLAAYDTSLPLVIDPVLLFSSFLGGNAIDVVHDIALDAAGHAYVTGETFSANFPVTPGSHDTSCGTGGPICSEFDAFVTKFNPSLSGAASLVYSTFLGGASFDRGNGIAVDGGGNAYVAATTRSTDFPLLNPYQASIGDGTGFNADVAFSKLNPAGSSLLYSTYLGGSDSDFPRALAVDPAGMAYVGGVTLSTNFPVRSALQGAFAGVRDGFVAKFNPAALGSASLVYSTYLGGSGSDEALGVAVDASGNAYAVGQTFSTNFPTMSALYGTFSGGMTDGFVSKLNNAGSALVYSTYLGGSGLDAAESVALDGSGNVYVTGLTASTNFPTATALQPANAGNDDAFVTKLNAAGNALVYSTYLGGSAGDIGLGIALDACSRAYVTGATNSLNFPSAIALQTYGGDQEAFIAGLNATGSTLAFSSYLGGIAYDNANGITVQGCLSTGNPYRLYVGGLTGGGNFPVVNAYQSAFQGGGFDGFVTALDIGTDADSDQLPDLVELEEGRNPTVKDNDIFTSARLFALQQYRDFLFREGDPGGISYWMSAVSSGGASRAQVVEFFLNSTEFQGTFAPITRLYFAYFLSIPDYAGLLFWQRAYRAGAPLSEISEAFAATNEFQNTYGHLTDEEFVTLVYQNVLGRDPDSQELDFWTRALQRRLSRADLMLAVSQSAEYLLRSFNWVYVTQMYVGMLRRVPEQTGFDFWVTHLDAGGSGLALIQGFLNSTEYHNRFLP